MQTHLSGIVRKMILNLDDTNKKKGDSIKNRLFKYNTTC